LLNFKFAFLCLNWFAIVSKKLGGGILVLSAFCWESDARFKEFMTDKEPVEFGHRACHRISNLGSSKGLAPV
jgi:hypothetical protein